VTDFAGLLPSPERACWRTIIQMLSRGFRNLY
jgi:hypothetical protein